MISIEPRSRCEIEPAGTVPAQLGRPQHPLIDATNPNKIIPLQKRFMVAIPLLKKVRSPIHVNTTI